VSWKWRERREQGEPWGELVVVGPKGTLAGGGEQLSQYGEEGRRGNNLERSNGGKKVRKARLEGRYL